MQNIHLNLAERAGEVCDRAPGRASWAGEGWLFGAGRSSHPAISNAAFRTGDTDPEELLARAQVFFGSRARGFSLWVRGGVPEDSDLIEAAGSAGLKQVFATPEMTLRRRAEERPLPEGVERRQLGTAAEVDDYWRVATSAYADNGFPPEIFRYYEDHSGLTADNTVALLPYQLGKATRRNSV